MKMAIAAGMCPVRTTMKKKKHRAQSQHHHSSDCPHNRNNLDQNQNDGAVTTRFLNLRASGSGGQIE
jgi:hypothetical protein